jgi:hypothetical protein
LVGGVFNAVNQGVYAARANPMDPKVVHNFRWLHDWARLAALPLSFPSEHHPVKSVLAMRVCCQLESGAPAILSSSIRCLFRPRREHRRPRSDRQGGKRLRPRW